MTVPGQMSKENMAALVEAQLTAYNARDLDRFCACYHEEIEVAELMSEKIVYSGMAELRSRYEKMFRETPTLHCEIMSRSVFESHVVDVEHVTAAQVPHGHRFVVVYSFRDGKIGRLSSIGK